MRAFAAIVPPEEIIEDLVDFLAPRRHASRQSGGRSGGPRWTRDEHLHLTLAFLPELAEADVDEVARRMAQACARWSAEPVRLAGAGAFPDAAGARVLWIGIEPAGGATPELDPGADPGSDPGCDGEDPRRPAAGLTRLARSVRTAAGTAGARVQGGPFRPHVTVARLPRPQDATRYLRILDGYCGPQWTPREVTLLRSHLGQGPNHTPRYEVLDEFPTG